MVSIERQRAWTRGMAGSAGAVVIGQAVPGLLSLLLAPVIIEQLGAQRFGLFSVVLSAQIVSALADLGTANTVLTEVPKARAINDVDAAWYVVRFALRIACTIAAGLVLVAIVELSGILPFSLAQFLSPPPQLEADASAAIVALLFAVAATVVGTVFVKLRQAEGKVGRVSLQLGAAATLGGMATLLAAEMKAPVWVLVLCSVGPMALIRLWMAIPALRELRAPREPAEVVAAPAELPPTLGRLTIFFTYIQLVAVLAYQIDQLVLAALTDLEEVANYALVSRVAAPGMVVIGAVGAVIWPEFSAAVARHDAGRVRFVASRSIAVLVTISTAVAGAMVVVGPRLWPTLGRGEVVPTTALVVGFGCMLVLRAVDSVTSVLLNAVPVVGFQVVCATVLLIVNVGLTAALSLRWGAAGAIWGTVLAQLPVITIPYLFRVRREIDVVAA